MKRTIALFLAVLLLLAAGCGRREVIVVEQPVVVVEEPVEEIANPWVEVTDDDILLQLGVMFDVPVDAQEVTFYWNEYEGIAQMSFYAEDAWWDARIKATSEFEDISGLYYEWETEQVNTSLWMDGVENRCVTDEGYVCSALWYDTEFGMTYSLSVVSAYNLSMDIAAEIFIIYG